jgi:MFS family permease
VTPASSPFSRPVLALVAAEIVSGLGSYMTFLALPWFVLVTTGSPTRMGIVLAAELLPAAIVGIPSGTVVTRIGARNTMLVCDLARAPIVAAVPLLHAADLLSFPLLLVLVALTGVFAGPYFASQRLVLPELLGEDEGTIARANSIVEGAQRLNAFAGPAFAGVLIAGVGASTVLYIDAVTFLVSASLVATFVPRRQALGEEDESGGMLAGVKFVLRDRFLGPMMVSVVISNMLGQAMIAALPVLAYEEFGRSARVAGAFFAAMGIGSLIGSFAAFWLSGRFSPIRIAIVSVLAGAVPKWLLGLDLSETGIVIVLAAAAFWNPIGNAVLIGLMTVRTPVALRAKMMTAVITFAVIAGPIGLVLAAPALGALGARTVFIVIAAGATASALWFTAVALRTAGEHAVVPAT